MPPRSIWAFASGANSPGNLAGFARAGIPPGISMLRDDAGTWKWLCGSGADATWAARQCWQAVKNIALKLKIPVFVDTGAFSELGTPKPIPPRLWREMLTQQIDLAVALGPLAVIVLPDKVGDQTATLKRLETYADEVNQLLDAGARGIAVLQKGRRSPAQTAERVAEILGRYDWIVGFPVRAKMEPEEVRATLEEISWEPAGAHLLGIGPANAQWGEYTNALAPLAAAAWASSDAVVLKRLVQRQLALGPLTEQQDIVREAIVGEAWSALWDPLPLELVDPTEQLGSPSDWMPGTLAAAIAREGVMDGWLTKDEARIFRQDPTEGRNLVLQRGEPGPEWWLDLEIEKAWWARLEAMSTQTRTMRALVQLFGERPPTPVAIPELRQMVLGVPGQNDDA